MSAEGKKNEQAQFALTERPSVAVHTSEQEARKALEAFDSQSASAKSADSQPPEGGAININLLLFQLVQKSDSPTSIAENARTLLSLTKDFENARLESFIQRTNAQISAKERDPDEIEKRASNKVRRVMKYTIATVMAGSLIVSCALLLSGAITFAKTAVLLLLLSILAICVIVCAVMASGESVSSNDIVRILNAASSAFGKVMNSSGSNPNGSDEQRGKQQKEQEQQANKRRPNSRG